ncbi:Eco57I restriction-modification methylase domain-containing protein [Mediterraneibacter faecis]|uniref:Eco57I restriction-modification methylase domain-containing protein n=1 Tax=Mediterraneibacter faecis TaxID=592978 RepID=UPI003F98DFDA
MSSAVIEKIEKVLTSEYSIQNFVEFVQEVFDTIKLVAPDKYRKEYTNFSSHIAGSTHVGNYTDPDGKKLIIFSVELLNKTYVETSRSTQRSYAKKLIESAGADGALIAFYTEGNPKWRISFVRLDYEIKFENGKLKTAENMTPAKRYSYLVGKDEPCHTAIDRFRRFITDQNINPTLDELEEAFSVEAVTNEFFNLYCEKYKQLLIHLEDNQDFVIEAKLHNFTAAQFAKKLMGQIVFLYFLQKKGWLGVGAWPNTLTEKEYKNAFYARGAKSRELIPKIYVPVGDGTYHVSPKALEMISNEDEAILAQCVKGKPWGSGPHNFMRKLFEIAEKRGANFFDDYLEPLFYNALNVNRGEQGYDPELHCRIPFLSGGLFEPIDGYDWEHNDFAIPNEVFSNRINNNPRTGDGILDIFDRYNFTMSEDEPMEREVAIDPEMLGKVFENLLEVNDRKAKGAFYTPREIVHYMCQESLIEYLKNTIDVSEEAVRDFILYGDLMKDEDTVKEKRLGNNGMFISEELYKLDSEGNILVNKLLDMDKALANVRVADPAVGSGAFPLGMLNEIVRARQNISAYMAITMNAYETRMMYSMERSAHTLKYETIKNCIYAADLEPSAVDIAQLRLWLSLVIDDEINPDAQSMLDGHRNPLPLPNLECNILCGDSLLDTFEGIKLINASEIIGTAEEYQQQNIGMQRFNQILGQLIETQNKLFACEDTEKKKTLLDQISDLKNMIVMHQLYGCSDDIIEKYQRTRKATSKPYVLWQLDFAKVFKEKGGFDIVIGNPPYIQLQKSISDESDIKLGDLYVNQKFETFAKTGDIYCLFYEKGWRLLRKEGILSFITSNKWMRAGYGEKMRSFLTSRTNPIQLIDFAGQKIFESATVDVNILIFSKNKNEGSTKACVAREGCRDNLSVFVHQNCTEMSFSGLDSWTVLSPIEMSIKQKIEAVGTQLKDWDISINYGIKTGYNDAFIISGAVKDELIAADPKSAELIRPILRGRDIKRYSFTDNDLWIINTHNGIKNRNISPIDVNDYPAIKQHLDAYYPKLEKRADKGVTPFNLRNCAYMDDFSMQKVMYNDICQRLSFCLVPENVFCVNTVYFIKNNEHIKYLLAYLNTKIVDWYYRTLSVQLGQKAVRMFSIYVLKIPAPIVSVETEEDVNKLVDIINASPESNTEEIEQQIEEIFYKIFNFNTEEIEFIKNL